MATPMKNYPDPDPNALSVDLDLNTVAGRLEFWRRLKFPQGKDKLPLAKITPALVSFIHETPALRRTNRNRKRGHKNIQQMVQDIRSGRWIHGASTFLYDDEGRLGNGFGRCQAVIDSGGFIIVELKGPVSAETILVADRVTPQSPADYVRMSHGLASTDDANVFVPVLLTIRDHLFNTIQPANSSREVMEVLSTPHLQAWRQVWEVVRGKKSMSPFRKNGALAAFTYYIAYLQSQGDLMGEADLRSLWETLATNNQLVPGTAAHTISGRIASEKTGSRKAELQLMRRVMHGIEAHRSNRSLKSLDPRKLFILDSAYQIQIIQLG